MSGSQPSTLLAIAVAALLFLSACGSSEAEGPNPCSADAQDTLSTSTTAIPECFPLEIPSGGTVVESIVSNSEGALSYQIIMSYPADDFDRVVTFYTEETARFTDATTETTTDPDGTRNHLITSEAAELLVGITQLPDDLVRLLMFVPELEPVPNQGNT